MPGCAHAKILAYTCKTSTLPFRPMVRIDWYENPAKVVEPSGRCQCFFFVGLWLLGMAYSVSRVRSGCCRKSGSTWWLGTAVLALVNTSDWWLMVCALRASFCLLYAALCLNFAAPCLLFESVQPSLFVSWRLFVPGVYSRLSVDLRRLAVAFFEMRSVRCGRRGCAPAMESLAGAVSC